MCEQMESWATSGDWDVNFLCICVNGDNTSLPVAQDFTKRYKLKNILNGYIPSQDMLPSFGQLGCQGLVIADKNGMLVTKRSEALNAEGPSAFRAVERRLHKLGAYRGSKPDSDFQAPKMPDLRFSIGTAVECRLGPSLWVPGVVTEHWYRIQGRLMPYQVRLVDGRLIFAPADKDMVIRRAVIEEPIEMISVGVTVLDAEHESCAEALQNLRENPSPDSLQFAREALESHFEHEEEIFAKTGFGNHGTKLSGTKSHCDDHAKILSEIDAHLLKSNGRSVSKEFVEQLIKHVTKHTEDFDSKYAGHISETSV